MLPVKGPEHLYQMPVNNYSVQAMIVLNPNGIKTGNYTIINKVFIHNGVSPDHIVYRGGFLIFR